MAHVRLHASSAIALTGVSFDYPTGNKNHVIKRTVKKIFRALGYDVVKLPLRDLETEPLKLPTIFAFIAFVLLAPLELYTKGYSNSRSS